jgi:hypothetical protein
MKIPSKKGMSDDFQTPAIAIKPLLKYLKKELVIWDCACGNGNLTNAFTKEGYTIYNTDIKYGIDFLKSDNIHIDIDSCIVTNPPYSLKNEFLLKCYELNKPFALLLPLTTLETKKRQDLFKKHGIEIILLDKRINFETPNKVEKSSSWFATAWFTHGLNIGSMITFETL